jgi:phosphate transport system substrate-binding protein
MPSHRFSVHHLVWLTLALAVGISAGCGPEDADYWDYLSRPRWPNPELQGKIDIDGSSTVFPITEAAASEFRRRYPNVSVNVGVSGTGGGFKRFTRGETDISDASRPIDAKEFAAAVKAGVRPIELPIAYDGLTIVVHNDNDWVQQLSIAEIKTIYSAETAPKSWAEVRPGFPNRPIQPFAPGTDSGTFDYFREAVIGTATSLRPDMSTSEDDNVLVTGVSGTTGAIGFFGAAYYEENRHRVKAVRVVNPLTGEAVAPSRETIEAGQYAPLSRPLFIYDNARSAGRPEMKRFVEFFLENGSTLAATAGYVSLPPEIYEAGLSNFRERRAGTHYLHRDGEKRSGPVTEVFRAENLWEGA